MNRISLGRLFGFPLWVEPTALFVLALIVLPRAKGGPEAALEGLLTAGIIFGSILVHELGHATVARRFGLGPVEIVLHGFGGLARFARAPRPMEGVWVTLAGPGAGLALAVLGFVLLQVAPERWSALLAYAVGMNLFWSLFNLLPMFPLDGGFVLLHGLSTRLPAPTAAVWAARVGILTAIPVAAIAILQGMFFIVLVAGLAVFQSAPLALGRPR